MKIALFSDIHGNLPALEAVLADIDNRSPDAIYCLGDLVGYAPWPNEVTDEIRRRGIPTIAGNYDKGIGIAGDDCGCAYKTDIEKANGAISISYTNEITGDAQRAYLRALPMHIRLEFSFFEKHSFNMLLVHGSPRRVNEYLFEDRDEKSLLRIMSEANADIMAFGHTHKPYHRVLTHETDGAYRKFHAINTGSAGKPKDGDPRACYVMLTLEPDEETQLYKIEVEFIRVAYDIEKTALAIENSPLPNEYAEMLRKAY